jgi:hypothetical protein
MQTNNANNGAEIRGTGALNSSNQELSPSERRDMELLSPITWENYFCESELGGPYKAYQTAPIGFNLNQIMKEKAGLDPQRLVEFVIVDWLTLPVVKIEKASSFSDMVYLDNRCLSMGGCWYYPYFYTLMSKHTGYKMVINDLKRRGGTITHLKDISMVITVRDWIIEKNPGPVDNINSIDQRWTPKEKQTPNKNKPKSSGKSEQDKKREKKESRSGGECRTFAKTGSCKYGSNCKYSHNIISAKAKGQGNEAIKSLIGSLEDAQGAVDAAREESKILIEEQKAALQERNDEIVNLKAEISKRIEVPDYVSPSKWNFEFRKKKFCHIDFPSLFLSLFALTLISVILNLIIKCCDIIFKGENLSIDIEIGEPVFLYFLTFFVMLLMKFMVVSRSKLVWVLGSPLFSRFVRWIVAGLQPELVEMIPVIHVNSLFVLPITISTSILLVFILIDRYCCKEYFKACARVNKVIRRKALSTLIPIQKDLEKLRNGLPALIPTAVADDLILDSEVNLSNKCPEMYEGMNDSVKLFEGVNSHIDRYNLTLFKLVVLTALVDWIKNTDQFQYKFFYLTVERLSQKVEMIEKSGRVHGDLRADSHMHGDVKHMHPDYATMKVSNYSLRKNKGLTGTKYSDYKITESTFEVSLSAMAQFVSSEKISPYSTDAVNAERIKRCLSRLTTVNYDRKKFLWNEDILNQTAIVAQQWGFFIKEKLHKHILEMDPQ